MSRSGIREQVFRLLFRVEFNAPEELEEQKELFFDEVEDDEDISPIKEKDAQIIKSRFDDIVAKLEEIDALLQEKTEHWSMNRIGKVELTILRLAVYEIKFDEEIPDSVAINEAVELAKKYGKDESSGFVNGVLAKLV